MMPTPEITQPPRLPNAPRFPEPGLYFGMSDEEYHSIYACSSSGLKDLMISAGDHWECSVLNPDREDDDSPFKRLGRAYHVRVLMGREAFLAAYAPELTQKDFGEELVITVKQIRERITKHGGQPKGTAKTDLIEQLIIASDGRALIWDREVEGWAKLHEGKELLPRKDYDRIELSAAILEKMEPNPFSGGHAEVAFFWYDEETGVPCKAKLDYLKMNGYSDLKTFSSKAPRPVQRAVDFEIANMKHYLQVAFYHRAIAALKKLVKEAGPDVAHARPGAKGGERSRMRAWAWAWAHQTEAEAAFVYVRTTGAPIVIPRVMPRSSVYEIARLASVRMMKRWRLLAETHGAQRWIDIEPIRATVDEELPLSASDFGGI